MRKLAISAGHASVQGYDQGAVNDTLTEGKITEILKNQIVNYLHAYGIKVSVDPVDSVTKRTVQLFRKYFFGKDICVDLHFNSSLNKNATGTEVVIPAKYSEFEYKLALELSAHISSTLNIRNRGVITELQTYRKKLMWMTLPCETVLIEVCFLSNENDLAAYNLKEKDIARTIANILIKYQNYEKRYFTFNNQFVRFMCY
jgi:N-acetylmuramoyl-L-alanine amidase